MMKVMTTMSVVTIAPAMRECNNSVERVFRELKHQTECFSTCFSDVQPDTADDWVGGIQV